MSAMEQLQSESAEERYWAMQSLKARLNDRLDEAIVEDYAGRTAGDGRLPSAVEASETTGLPLERVDAVIERLKVRYGYAPAEGQLRLVEVAA